MDRHTDRLTHELILVELCNIEYGSSTGEKYVQAKLNLGRSKLCIHAGKVGMLAEQALYYCRTWRWSHSGKNILIPQ